MDGIFSAVRIHAGDRPLREGQVSQAWRVNVPRYRFDVHMCDRGSGLQAGKDRLCVFISRYCWDFAHSGRGAGYSVAVWDNVNGFDYSAMRDIAFREPLTDTFDLKAITTDLYQFKVEDSSTSTLFPTDGPLLQQIDMLAVKKEDLKFDAPFELTARRDDR